MPDARAYQYQKPDLGEALADLDLEVIMDLRHKALIRREEERLAKEAAELHDPAGTLRYDKRCSCLLVRVVEDPNDMIAGAESSWWTPYFREDHGEYVSDKYVYDNNLPVVGKIEELL